MIPDITNYNEKKAKNLILVQKIDDNNYAICTKQFSATDGSELPAEVQGLTITEIDEQIADYQTKIDELNVFKTNIIGN
jgi:hypothetical protein